MKNTHIKNLLEPVPRELRIEIYKELLERIKKKQTLIDAKEDKQFHLCVYLPVVLWGFTIIYQSAPDGGLWHMSDVPKAFPEFTNEIIDSIYDVRPSTRNAVRAELLKEWIKQLED
jgi:hypothetical protein